MIARTRRGFLGMILAAPAAVAAALGCREAGGGSVTTVRSRLAPTGIRNDPPPDDRWGERRVFVAGDVMTAADMNEAVRWQSRRLSR